MKLRNNGEKFMLIWDGKDFEIPEGTFEVENTLLALFINEMAIKWQKPVEIIDSTDSSLIKKAIEPATEIKVEPIEDGEKKKVVEEKVEELVKAPNKKK